MSCRRAAALAAPVLAALAAAAGCAISLDAGGDDAPPSDGGAPTLAGCAVFRDDARGLAGATGRVRSWTTEGGSVLYAVDGLHVGSGAVEPAVFAGEPAGETGCLASVPDPPPSRPALDLSALGDGLSGRLLGIFEAGGARLAFVQTFTGMAPVGVALARWDDAAAGFVADPGYLFTGDRPVYGDAVLVDGDTVYAYGCRGTGFLTDSCYLARVAAAAVADRTAYEFYRGGDEFGPDPDTAWPLFTGGGGLAVVARGARVYAAYVTPLGDRITARSGLGPSGPWSAPVELGRCELPDSGFCTALAAHPGLDADPAWLSLTHGIASFEALTPEQRATRLVRVPLGALP